MKVTEFPALLSGYDASHHRAEAVENNLAGPPKRGRPQDDGEKYGSQHQLEKANPKVLNGLRLRSPQARCRLSDEAPG